MPLKVEGFSGGDRTAIELPAAQQQLVHDLSQALAATGKPLILVLMNGSALALGDAANLSPAILEAWYPGQAGGTAIAQTLFGDNNPSGRLPLTFYAATTQLPAFDDYSMANRTYRYFTGQPLYPFGWGLSYTTFTYTGGKLTTPTLEAGQPLEASVELKNTGHKSGTETIEFYLIPKSKPGAPLRALAAFQKVNLAPGATTTIHTTIDPRQLSLVDAAGLRSIQPGDYDLYIGGHQPTPNSGVTLPFQIKGAASIAP